MYNVKVASILGMAESLDRNGIINADSPVVEKVASFILENVDFDPTNPADLQKVAVAFIDLLDKEAQQGAGNPDNTLEADQLFAAALEKARAERNGVNKGVKGVGESEMANKGIIGLMQDANRAGMDNPLNTLTSDQLFAAALEKARAERNGVNKGRWGVGQSEMVNKGVIGEEKKASAEISVDDLISYLQK